MAEGAELACAVPPQAPFGGGERLPPWARRRPREGCVRFADASAGEEAMKGAAGALATAILVMAIARPAAACAVCGAGDPTLNAAGTERPYAGRLRLSGDLRLGGARVGAEGTGLLELREERLDLGV